MFVVGLTGGIGSGKSVVANAFANLGIPIIDADQAARDVTQPGMPATKTIEKHFGNSMINPDGSLDRGALRQRVFSHPNDRQWLERLLHPLIREHMQAQIDQLEAPYCIAVIPLLLEAEFYHFVNRILVVDVPEETQIERVMARDNLSHEHVIHILKAQAKRTDRTAKAHDIIHNDGQLEDIRPQVEALHEKYLKLAAG